MNLILVVCIKSNIGQCGCITEFNKYDRWMNSACLYIKMDDLEYYACTHTQTLFINRQVSSDDQGGYWIREQAKFLLLVMILRNVLIWL